MVGGGGSTLTLSPSFGGGGTLNQRRLTDKAAAGSIPAETDATDGVSAENLLDYQIAGRKIRVGFSLGVGPGAARYRGRIILTKHSIKGALTGAATASISFQGTGALAKSIIAN